MAEFEKPKVDYAYDLATERKALRELKVKRGIPEKTPDTLLIATWNLANFGAQDRRDDDIKLIAKILSWFDLIAMQEVRENKTDFEKLMLELDDNYQTHFTDVAGNEERMAYIYDGKKIETRSLVAEIALPPSRLKGINIAGVNQKFDGFDRNPFVLSFTFKGVKLLLANVHLFYGGDTKAKIGRRQLETLAVAKWARDVAGSKYDNEPNVIVLGDFNLPHMKNDDPIYAIFQKYGIKTTRYATTIGSTLPGEKKKANGEAVNIYHYDQIGFYKALKGLKFGETNVLDFDSVVFSDLWNKYQGKKNRITLFNAYVRYYISDHRPLWVKAELV